MYIDSGKERKIMWLQDWKWMTTINTPIMVVASKLKLLICMQDSQINTCNPTFKKTQEDEMKY